MVLLGRRRGRRFSRKRLFDCEFRGKVAAKHKGEIDMYFVNGIRRELSGDPAGRIANEKFLESCRRLECQTQQ
jgi:hypothetical protein